MNTDDPGDNEAGADRDEPTPEALDDLIASHAALSRPAVELARQAAAAMRPIHDVSQSQFRMYRLALEALNSPGMRAAMDAAARQQKLVQDVVITSAFRTAMELANSPGAEAAAKMAAARQNLMNQLANSPAARVAADLAETWQRIQTQSAHRMSETVDAIASASKQIWPWLRKVAETAGQAISTIYRQAAPPNWINNETTPFVSYTAAVSLALEEGIPLAWVPDYDTVQLLLAVPAGHERRTALRAILNDRSADILDHCQTQLDELANPGTHADRLQMIDVARQAIEALRADLPAPAQSAAANLADQLLRRLFIPIDGKYTYKATSTRVTNLSAQVNTLSLSFLAILRELATLMPVPMSLTEWWPNKGMALPVSFSRHATAHAIAEPGQVNTVNALVAIMLSVSLLCQEAASRWTTLGTFVWSTRTDTESPDTLLEARD